MQAIQLLQLSYNSVSANDIHIHRYIRIDNTDTQGGTVH